MSKGDMGDTILTSRFWPADVPVTVGTPRLLLHDAVLRRWAQDTPEKTALVSSGTTVSYGAMEERSNVVARRLMEQGASNSSVVVALESQLDSVTVLLGALKAQCQVVFLKPLLSKDASPSSLTKIAPKTLFADDAAIPVLKNAETAGARIIPKTTLREWLSSAPKEEREPLGTRFSREEIALIFLVEKSGVLEQVLHTHQSVLASLVSFTTFMAVGGEDTSLNTLPLAHWAGVLNVLSAMYWGGTAVLAGPEEERDLTGLLGRSAATYGLFDKGSLESIDLQIGGKGRSKVRWLGCLVQPGDVMAQGLHKKLEMALGFPILQVYGSPEAGVMLSNHWSWNVHGAAGIPLTNMRVTLLDPLTGGRIEEPWEMAEASRLAVSGPMRMKGYRRAEANARYLREEWFMTDAIVEMDPNGVFHFVERRDP